MITEKIERVSEIKSLDVIIDEKLKTNCIYKICSLKNVFFLICHHCTLCMTFMLPYMIYCFEVWGNMHSLTTLLETPVQMLVNTAF